jgi:O-antigen/teichoic acid export membrane protein
MTISSKKVISGVISQYLYQIILMSLQILVAPILLKINGEKALGGYASIMQFTGYLTLLDLGFSSTLSRYLAQTYHNNKESFGNYFAIGRWYLMCISILMFTIIISLSFVIPYSIGLDKEMALDAHRAMIILACWYGCRFYFTMFGIALYSSQQMKSVNICLTIGVVFRLALTILFLYLGYAITGIVVANIVGDLITALLQMAVFTKQNPNSGISWKIYDKSAFKELFSFGLDTFLINISTRIILSSTTFVSSILLGAVAAAHYYTMVTPITLIFTFINMIMYNMLPGMNGLVSKGATDELGNIYSKIIKLKMTLLIAAFWGLILFHEFIISIWVGKSQYEGFYFTAILSVYLIVITISSLNENVLIVLGDIKWFSKLQIAGTVVGLLLTIAGAYQWGLKGVVLGNLIGLLPVAIYVLYRLVKFLKLDFTYKNLMPPVSYVLSISSVTIIIFLVQHLYFGGGNFVQLALSVIIFFSLIFFFALDNDVRNRIVKIIKR